MAGAGPEAFLRSRLDAPTVQKLDALGNERVWSVVEAVELLDPASVFVATDDAADLAVIPRYEDLEHLFRTYLDQDYPREAYAEQFRIRTPELFAKLDRIEAVYRAEAEVPEQLFEHLSAQRKRLEALRVRKGEYVSPFDL
jgi:hypothetical protein